MSLEAIRFGSYHNIDFDRKNSRNDPHQQDAVKHQLYEIGATRVQSNGYSNTEAGRGTWYSIWAPDTKDTQINDYLKGLKGNIKSYSME